MSGGTPLVLFSGTVKGAGLWGVVELGSPVTSAVEPGPQAAALVGPGKQPLLSGLTPTMAA